jgi:hypothetical protein
MLPVITKKCCRQYVANCCLGVRPPLGSDLSLEKLGQTFFAVIMTKTPLLMGFLVYELNCHTYIIYQGTDILPEIFSSSPDRRVFAARKLHEGFSPRVILSDKHECWTARKNFWRYISVPRYIRKRIARKNFSLGQLYRKFSLGKISA